MGSPGGGAGGSSSPGGGPGGGESPGRGSDDDNRTSSKSESKQAGMTGSERTQEAAFNEAMENERANQPGGPEFGDTTPGYSGPNPDPRGPALDNGPDDRDDEDNKPAPANPGSLPGSDTTPGYAGPVADPRGPALSDGEEDEKGAFAMAGTVALGFAAADGPVSPIGDIIGLGVGLSILGYAGYQALTNPPPTGPLLSEKPEEVADQPTRPADKPGKIASETGLTEKEVREKIHEAKGNMPRGGEVKNPDVAVDLDTGEIHPKNENGTYGDSIGNIYD